MQDYIGKYDFGIGKIDSFIERGVIGNNIGRTSITYSYTVDRNNFTKSYDSFFYKVPLEAKKEELYLIIYNINIPQNSLLLRDYPIPNIQNFNEVVNQYKIDSPNLFE